MWLKIFYVLNIKTHHRLYVTMNFLYSKLEIAWRISLVVCHAWCGRNAEHFPTELGV